MIPFDLWFLPDGEHHLQQWMTTANKRVEGRLTYQYHKYEAALDYCRQRRGAIDIGAHAGLWSYWMARDFAQLHAFEPMRAHRECWLTNMVGRRGNATLYGYALGNHHASVSLMPGVASTGDARVATNGEGEFPVLQTTLDTYGFVDIDFIKIDCEGYERYVVEGAVETLKRERPVLVVEQKTGHASRYGISDTDAIVFLRGLGYTVRASIAEDYILTWD